MKRILSRIGLIIAFLLCLPLFSSAEIITISDARIIDVAGSGGQLFCRTEDGNVYRCQPDDAVPILYDTGYDTSDYGGLFIADGVLYTLRKSPCQIIRIGQDRPDAPFDGLLIPHFEKRTGARDVWTPYAMQNTGTGLFWMMNVNDTDQAILCKFDLEKQELSSRSIDDLHAYCVHDDGTIWIIQRGMEGRILSAYHWEDATLEKLAVLPQGANGFVLQGDALLFNVKSEIMRRTPSGDIESVMYMPFLCDSRINSVLLDGDILTAAFSSQLACRSIQQGQNGQITLMVLNDDASTPGYLTFHQANPEVEVQFSQLKHYPNTIELAQQILTGELPYDVFRISSSAFDLQALADKGYLEDMTGSLPLLEAVLQMEPQVLEIAMAQDRLVAVPCGIHGSYTAYMADNLRQAGLSDQDIPRSYDAFYDFMINWHASGAGEDDAFCLFSIEQGDVFPFFLKELLKANIACYASQRKPVTFDTEEFRSLLTKCRQAAEAVEQENLAGYVLFELGYGRITDRQVIPLALTDAAEAVIPVIMDFYVINPLSANKQQALAYIESCVAAYTQEQRLQLYPAYREPIVNPAYTAYMHQWATEEEALKSKLDTRDNAQRAEVQHLLDDHQLRRNNAPAQYDISPDDIAYYKEQIAPRMFIPNSSMMDLTVHDTFAFETSISRYLDGNMSDDQFIEALENVCQMIAMEK